jgi:hypothetical protein
MILRVCGGPRVTSVRLPLPAHLQGPQPWGLGTGCLGTPGAGRHTLSFVGMAINFFLLAMGASSSAADLSDRRISTGCMGSARAGPTRAALQPPNAQDSSESEGYQRDSHTTGY